MRRLPVTLDQPSSPLLEGDLPLSQGPTDQEYEAWPAKGFDRRSRSTESGTIRACPIDFTPNAKFGDAPVVFKAGQRQLVGGSQRGRAFAPSVSAKGTEPHLANLCKRYMDASPDHEPTPSERGTGVDLNYPLTAHRGIRVRCPIRGLHE